MMCFVSEVLEYQCVMCDQSVYCNIWQKCNGKMYCIF